MQTISYSRWNPPESNLRIEFPPNLFSSLPASNGLLYGCLHGQDARLLVARAWPDDRLVPLPEHEQNPVLASLCVVGIFVTRRRGDVFLTETDLALFEKRKAHLALVVAGDRAGFFIRETDGSVRTICSYEEFPTAPEKLVPRPVPQPRRKPRTPWSWAAAVVIALLAVPLAGLAYFTPLLPAPTIALAVDEREGQLVATWNARAISSGSQIEITDGADRIVMPLKAGQSSATYRVRDGDLEVSINTSHGSESARFVTHPAPPPRTDETDAVSAEVARLEEQLRQLRETADQGRARIHALDGRIFGLSSR